MKSEKQNSHLHVQRKKVHFGNFEKNPWKETRSCWLELVFYPFEAPILKQHNISYDIFFSAIPKRYRESSCCEPFDAEHPKQYQNCLFFFNPLKVRHAPPSFRYGSSSPVPTRYGNTSTGNYNNQEDKNVVILTLIQLW